MMAAIVTCAVILGIAIGAVVGSLVVCATIAKMLEGIRWPG